MSRRDEENLRHTVLPPGPLALLIFLAMTPAGRIILAILIPIYLIYTCSAKGPEDIHTTSINAPSVQEKPQNTLNNEGVATEDEARQAIQKIRNRLKQD